MCIRGTCDAARACAAAVLQAPEREQEAVESSAGSPIHERGGTSRGGGKHNVGYRSGPAKLPKQKSISQIFRATERKPGSSAAEFRFNRHMV